MKNPPIEMSQDDQELLEWGVKFFELGFNAALEMITNVHPIVQAAKAKAVRNFIKENTLPKEGKCQE